MRTRFAGCLAVVAWMVGSSAGCDSTPPATGPDAATECQIDDAGESTGCATGEVCLSGRCFTACTATSGCGPREMCADGVCVAGPPSDTGPIVNDAGPPTCAMTCAAPTPYCIGTTCVACRTGADCATGFCDVASGVCAMRPSGSAGQCGACASDLDCESGFSCVLRSGEGEPREQVCLRRCTPEPVDAGVDAAVTDAGAVEAGAVDAASTIIDANVDAFVVPPSDAGPPADVGPIDAALPVRCDQGYVCEAARSVCIPRVSSCTAITRSGRACGVDLECGSFTHPRAGACLLPEVPDAGPIDAAVVPVDAGMIDAAFDDAAFDDTGVVADVGPIDAAVVDAALPPPGVCIVACASDDDCPMVLGRCDTSLGRCTTAPPPVDAGMVADDAGM